MSLWANGWHSAQQVSTPNIKPKPTQYSSIYFSIFLVFSIPQKFFCPPSFSYCNLSLHPPLSILYLVIISVHTGIISLENESLLKFCILLILYMFWEPLFRAGIGRKMWKGGKALLLGSRPPSTGLLNSTTLIRWISGVRHSKSHIRCNEVLRVCSLYIYNLSSSKVISLLSAKVKRGQSQSSQNISASRIYIQHLTGVRKEEELIIQPPTPTFPSYPRKTSWSYNLPLPPQKLSQESLPNLWFPPLHSCVTGFVDNDSFSSLINIVVHPKIGSYPV